MGFLNQKVDIRKKINEQCRKIRSEIRQIDRNILKTQNEQKKIEYEMKTAAKNNKDHGVIRIYAKSLVDSRRQVSKMFSIKAKLSSLEMQLKENMASAKMTNSIKCSTDVIKIINSLVNIREVHDTMTEMSREMIKMGMMDEMITDTIDAVMHNEDEETEVENEINSVINEIVQNIKTTISNAPTAEKIKSNQHISTINKPLTITNNSKEEDDEERLRQLLSK